MLLKVQDCYGKRVFPNVIILYDSEHKNIFTSPTNGRSTNSMPVGDHELPKMYTL
jgi:hypothetical protein